jgi:uncharacterized membrane protein YeaQ/YmgE (transglycosylase-associated protein family)
LLSTTWNRSRPGVAVTDPSTAALSHSAILYHDLARITDDDGGQMGIIAFIILGLIAGAIAKALLPGDDPGGFIVTAIIGVVGALLGGFLAAALFDAHPLDEFFDISTWITAIVGSIVLLLIYRAVVGRGRVGRHA